MMRFDAELARLRSAAAITLALLVAACSSVPTRYFTLVAPARALSAGPEAAPFAIDVLPVGVPAQVDQPQLVIRTGPGSVAVLDSEHWVAPLADEIRGALANDLVRLLGARDAHGQGLRDGDKVYRITLDVRRFESVPADHALIDADWSVRSGGEVIAACGSRMSEPVGAGYEALVEGHQRALERIAARISTVVRRAAAGSRTDCAAR
jgi:uncharacterized lipoprotein YmbA